MTKDMTQGSPLKLLLAFAVPLMLGSLFQQFYNLADTIIVGRFVGVEALAAVGSVGGLNYLVLGFVNGIACGFSIPISWTFGAKDYKEMRRYTANTVWLSIAFATVLTIVTVAMTRLVLVWTNTPTDIIDLADIYIRTIFAGIPFTLLYNVTSALMRALGDSKRPLYFLLVASVLNIGLDLACIILFNMGVFGAAFATVFSQAVAGIGSLIYIMRHYPELRWSREEGRISAPHCAKLCAMGLPMGLQCSITAIGSVVLQGAVNGLGSSIVAAFLAAVAIGVFSEIMARLRRCPVTGYLLVALLPLVPGGGIYYAMSYCVAGDTDRFLAELLHTFGMAAALAVGAMLASSVFRTVFPRLYHRPAGS